MSRTRIVLATLGLAAAVGIPAIALASSGAAAQSCCDTADPTITCPMTGERIKESDCPLCQSRK